MPDLPMSGNRRAVWLRAGLHIGNDCGNRQFGLVNQLVITPNGSPMLCQGVHSRARELVLVVSKVLGQLALVAGGAQDNEPDAYPGSG